jgi:hypothetical protein
LPETDLGELVSLDPDKDPFVLIIGGSVGRGKLGDTSNPESLVDVIVNEIVYVPWNAENEPPRKMNLVLPSELAAELGAALADIATTIPTAGAQALALITNEETA